MQTYSAYVRWSKEQGVSLPPWGLLPEEVQDAWVVDTDHLMPRFSDASPRLKPRIRTAMLSPLQRRPSRRPGKRGYVYFIGAVDGPIKIGMSQDPTERLRSLQTGSPVALRLMAVVPSQEPEQLEVLLHARFGSLRMHGEWFHPGEELMEFIKQL